MEEFLKEQWFPIVLFVISTGVSYWFWKNPVSDELSNERFFEAEDGTIYTTGDGINGWIVEKIIPQNVKKQLPYTFQASKKNNRHINSAPQTLDDLRKLNYEVK